MKQAKSLDLMTAPLERRASQGQNQPGADEATKPARLWSATRPGEKSTLRTLPPGTGLEVLKGGGGIDTQAGNGNPFGFPSVLNSPFVYTRYRLFPDIATVRNAFPTRTVGKLFFSIPDAGDFVCSASAVASDNQSLVWTAGHCVSTPPPFGPVFHTNFLFVPSYYDPFGAPPPQAPFGVWTAQTAATLTAWIFGGLLEYDHGALVMNRGGLRNDFVTATVGGLGFATHMPRLQHWHLEGYPAGFQSPPSPGPLFDGGHHEVCAATAAVLDLPTGTPGVDPPTTGVGCDQTGGTSGGPWVLDLTGSPGGVLGNLLNGNNSYRYVGCAPTDFCNLELYGPYFGDGAYILKIFAESFFVE
jgi:hypothetical protein